jgi:hypothetical protein
MYKWYAFMPSGVYISYTESTDDMLDIILQMPKVVDENTMGNNSLVRNAAWNAAAIPNLQV